MTNKQLKVKCPQCEKAFSYYNSDFRPFCSERCKAVDLGHWLEGNYTVPSKSPLDDNDLEEVIQYHEKDQDES